MDEKTQPWKVKQQIQSDQAVTDIETGASLPVSEPKLQISIPKGLTIHLPGICLKWAPKIQNK